MWFARTSRESSPRSRTEPSQEPAVAGLRLDSGVYRQLDRLQLTASRFLRGRGVGSRASFRRKPAIEFREHRKYVPGDDLRFIDWKASARHEHYFLRQGEQPKEASIYLVIDCSGSMRWGHPPKSRAQLLLAAALGYVALSQGDRLTVLPVGGDPWQNPWGPISGKGQVPGLLHFLFGLEFASQVPLEQAILQALQPVSPPGLVLILSDLMGVSHLSDLLARLPAPTWDVVVIHMLHPSEIVPTQHGNWELVDIETGSSANYDIDSDAVARYAARIAAWKSAMELECVEHRALYISCTSDERLEPDLLGHLRALDILRPT